MLLPLFHRIIDFLRIIKLLYTHTCEVKETDAGTYEAIDRTKALDVFIKLNDIDHTHGLVFTIDKPLQLKKAKFQQN